MISIRIQKSYRHVVGVCDSNLVGKKFEEGKLQLDVKESFYKDPKEKSDFSEKEAKKILEDMRREDATFNIVGKESINVALEAGIIDEDGIGKIQGIPFALVLA